MRMLTFSSVVGALLSQQKFTVLPAEGRSACFKQSTINVSKADQTREARCLRINFAARSPQDRMAPLL
jgi:hypothetical protein